MEKTKTFWNYERYLFAAFVLITAIPLLANKYFPTLDGPAHLHNANLLKQIWFKGATNISDFYTLNIHLNSNFIDHVWFAVVGLFLPTFLVEKSIVLFYVIALPYSFRFLIKKISSNLNSAQLSSYLIFPFVYSFTFRIGFFNFCIGLPLVFWTLGTWIKEREDLNTKKLIWLTILSTMIYVSHLFNFILLGIVLFTNELQHIIHSKTTKELIRKLWKPFLIFIPGMLLSVMFLVSNSAFEHAPPKYLPKAKLTEMLMEMSPIITLNRDSEILYIRIIEAVMLILIILVLFQTIKNRKEENQNFRPKWIYSMIIVIIAFYSVPDWVASGGLISVRWGLFFFLILVILSASKELKPKHLFIPLAILMINHLFFINYHNKQTEVLSKDAETLVDAERYMDDKSVLLPLNYSANWLHIFHANYLATQKNIINLDNYEPTQPHFPLIGKKGEHVYDLMPKYANRNPPCVDIDNYESKTHHRIDYLSRFYFNGDVTDSCTAIVEKEIHSRFELIYESADKKLQLYKRKPNT
jgi:hypothetical protein